MNVGEVISKAIKEGKWININYHQSGGNTTFWIAVLDIIDNEKRILKVSMFNDAKSLKALDVIIYYDKIISARIIDFSFYQPPTKLIEKIENNLDKYQWLHYDSYNHNVLKYYEECNYLDCDPFQKEYCMIPGIDLQQLRKNKEYKLNDNQVKIVLNKIYRYDIKNEDKSNFSLIISVLSIDNGNKKYLICYYDLFFDPERLSLKVSSKLRFNNSFFVEGRKHSLFNYVSMNVDDFIDGFIENYHDKVEILRKNLKKGEVINQRPDIMILEKDYMVNLSSTYSEIETEYQNNTLNVPLKSFFGNISRRNIMRRSEPLIVIYDNKININQMRVIYNAMKYPVTYVQGPPGTGKTQTILNVILSSFFESKTVLICSSNNKPVDGIIEKIRFIYKNEDVLFPFLRLGKLEEVMEATKKIKKLYEYQTKKVVKENLIDKIKAEAVSKNGELLKLLNIQERRIEIEEYIDNSKRLLSSLTNDNAFTENIKTRIEQLKKELTDLPIITNEQVVKLFTPLCSDYRLCEYLYFKSLGYINKLKEPKYKELIKICYIEDDETRAMEFNKWIQDDNNMKLLNNAFPFIFSTNISSHRLGSASFKFDLVIMDEAGQCNAAHALIPIVRAKSLLLVGDPNQLKPVIILEEQVNEDLMKKYGVNEDYNYKENSILDIMIKHDNISKYILLKYHYRCGKKIIKFSNDRYYQSLLDVSAIKNEGKLEFLNVKNNHIAERNSAFEEANAVVEYVKRNNISNASIITPFINQQTLINKMLKDNNIEDVTCGTIHSLQGDEKDTIILSTAISPRTSKATYAWIRDNYELINVATTRAKNKLVIASDLECIKALSDKKDDLYNLIKYVYHNGETIIPPNENIKLEIGKSNGSKNEDEFFKTISQFCSVHNTYEVKRNVKIRDLFKDDETLSNSNLEFDIVIYEKKLFSLVPSIAIELNGGEHFGNHLKEHFDVYKMEICQKKKIKLLCIPNSFIKSYEYIKELIIGSKNKKSTQISLFDLEEID